MRRIEFRNFDNVWAYGSIVCVYWCKVFWSVGFVIFILGEFGLMWDWDGGNWLAGIGIVIVLGGIVIGGFSDILEEKSMYNWDWD